ncbi:hypothetical protein PINS_up006747 [Pythium insidiosum]|nr:hypothetical protein PINS_up006747 [Pythium insidiosum]
MLLLTVLLSQAVAPVSATDDLRPLSSITTSDVLVIVLMAAGLAMASAGGVGGGTIVVPLLVLGLGFDIKFASPSSNFILMGGAIANAMFNLRKRHPHADRPLVDPDVCLAMVPAMMGGAVLGAFFSRLLPSYAISILFVVLLALAGARTTHKALRLYRAEKQTHEVGIAVPNSTRSNVDCSSTYHELKSPHRFLGDVSIDLQDGADAASRLESNDDSTAETLAQLVEEERHFSWTKHGLVVLCYVGILIMTIAGGLFHCGSVAYWVLLWIEIPWVLCFTAIFIVYMTKRRALKLSVGFPKVHGDIDWTGKTVVLFPLGCMAAGIVAGLFGVGGAIIAGPLMLEFGMIPEVASSISALLVLYSSAAATTKFALFNQIAWDWSIALSIMTFVVTATAQVFVLGYVRRTGKQSIIVFCVAATILVGAALMSYSAVTSTIEEAHKPFKIEFCGSRGSK